MDEARALLGSWAALLLCAVASWSCGGGPSAGGSCNSNQDCITGETCISGTCQSVTGRPRCTTDEQCAFGDYCDTDDGLCKPVDTGGTDGGAPGRDGGGADAGEIRDASNGLCFSDPECGTPPIDICVANQCVKGCNEAGGLACTGGTVCDVSTGHCVSNTPTCNMDSECGPPAQVCENNACVPGCGLDPTLCVAGQLCNTNTGRCVAAPMPCTTDQNCSPPNTVCEGTQCVPGCGQNGGIQCSGQTPNCDPATGRCTAGGGCNLDADCMDPTRICVSNACVLRCDQPGGLQCVSPQVCNPASGRCLAGGLALGANCTANAECTSNYCLSITISMMSRMVCTDPCSATSNCPVDFTCGDVSGMSFCLHENLVTPAATWDTPSGGVCSATVNTCQSGWCNTGTNQCIETCSRNADCVAYGGQCWTYEQTGTNGISYDEICYAPGSGAAPGAPCSQNAGCRSGVCNRYNGTCAAHCCADGGCPAAQSCTVYDLSASSIVKICTPRTPGAGTAALGASCTMPSDCESEVCAPIDPANMASPRRCSTTCCRNQDCSAIPSGGSCRAAQGPVTNTIFGLCIPN